jgi:hypothetical protein
MEKRKIISIPRLIAPNTALPSNQNMQARKHAYLLTRMVETKNHASMHADCKFLSD